MLKFNAIAHGVVEGLHEDRARSLIRSGQKIVCKPFLKWAGGKSQLLPELASRIPHNFSRYFEPFVGSGALFFSLQPQNAYLSDINSELINTYQVIRENIDELIVDLTRHVYNPEYFYKLRHADRTENYQKWSNVQKASRLIYLNKTCYNGLYRVNSQGQFNVPLGKYTNPNIVNEENLRACHAVLQNTEICVGSFICIEEWATQDDFIYFDPPYAPLSQTANFTSYSQTRFDEAMQVALKNLCDRLTEKKVRFMLSNSAAPFILDLYQGYQIDLVDATRAINSKANQRGKIKEVIITNY
jgi:DNA adenine methylase